MAHQRLAPLDCARLHLSHGHADAHGTGPPPRPVLPESNRRDRRRARRRGRLRRDSSGRQSHRRRSEMERRDGHVRPDRRLSRPGWRGSADPRPPHEPRRPGQERRRTGRGPPGKSRDDEHAPRDDRRLAGSVRQLCGFKVRRSAEEGVRRTGQEREARRWRRRSRSAGLVDVDTPGRLRRVLRCDGPTGSIRQMAARAQGRRPGRQRPRSCTPGLRPMHKAASTTSTGTQPARSRRTTIATSHARTGGTHHTVLHAEGDRRGRRGRSQTHLGGSRSRQARRSLRHARVRRPAARCGRHRRITRCWPHAVLCGSGVSPSCPPRKPTLK